FSCNSCYALVGQQKLRCENGIWNDSPPKCVLISCPKLNPPSNGEMNGQCDPGICGSECKFSCNNGFRISGSASLQCLPSAQWSSSPPSCIQLNCPPITKPSNGEMNGACSSGIHSGTCSFSCKTCYNLVGQKDLKCDNGVWNDSPPKCILITCSKLSPPSNGGMSGQCDPGVCESECKFSCKNGFSLSSSASLQCLPSAQWSSSPPSCVPANCPPLKKPKNAEMNKVCSSGIHGGTCSFSCKTCFNLVGQQKLRCENGVWNDSPPKCVLISCPKLSPPSNGEIEGQCDPGICGSECKFSCKNGFTLLGSASIRCLPNTKWSSFPSSCVPSNCSSLTNPSNGKMDGVCSGIHSGTCSFSCNTCFNLVGQQDLKCENGSWNNSPPKCSLISCPKLSSPSNGEMNGQCDPGICGSECKFSCNKGFTLAGSRSLLCLKSAQWSSSPPSCIQLSCPPITNPTNGEMKGDCSPGSHNSTCSFSCNSCYSLVGQNSLTCENGAWNGEPPKCELVSCRKLTPPLNSLMSGQCEPGMCGSECKFSCKKGFSLSGSASLQCLPSAQWSSSPPSCVPANCPPLKKPKNAEMNEVCSSGIHGGTCSFSCNSCYALVGQQKLRCENGVWNDSPPKCVLISCPKLNPPSNGRMNGQCVPGICGFKCTFSCNTCHTLVGQQVLNCENGDWNGSPPKCISISCSKLSPPSNGEIKGQCDPGICGSECEFSCKNGFTL
ncbi:P-selectin-like isoform X1, partial [Dinothrombium tinctorium]